MPDGVNKVLLVAVLALLSIYFFMRWWGIEESKSFELTADRILMEGWKMEPSEYAGLGVTKITSNLSLNFNLSLSPLGISAERLEMRNFTMYAPSVEGTARGIGAGWEGNEVPVEAIELLLPSENAEMVEVRVKFTALEAKEIVPLSLVARASSVSLPLQVNMPSVRMWGWTMEGPKEVEFSGRKVKVTEIRAERLSGEFYLGYGPCVLGGKLEQRGARIWAVETAGEMAGFRAGWRGDQAPQEGAIRSLAGDPATLLNTTLKLLLLSADNTILTEVVAKVL